MCWRCTRCAESLSVLGCYSYIMGCIPNLCSLGFRLVASKFERSSMLRLRHSSRLTLALWKTCGMATRPLPYSFFE